MVGERRRALLRWGRAEACVFLTGASPRSLPRHFTCPRHNPRVRVLVQTPSPLKLTFTLVGNNNSYL